MSSNNIKQRVNFASIKNPLPYPDFLEVQLKSFQDFLQLDTPLDKHKNEGLYKVFAENFPIADTRNNFVLEFLDYFIDRSSAGRKRICSGDAECCVCFLLYVKSIRRERWSSSRGPGGGRFQAYRAWFRAGCLWLGGRRSRPG